MWLPARPCLYSCGPAGGQGYLHSMGQEKLWRSASQGRQVGRDGSGGEYQGRVSGASKIDGDCQHWYPPMLA